MATVRPRPLVAGNWKMNGLKGGLVEIAATARGARDGQAGEAELALCPPATLLGLVDSGAGISLGGQDCHVEAAGARTGDISAEMLADLGARYVIVGHSERRADHGESDALVAEKVKAAWRAGLVAIACVGETRAEREAGQALEVVGRQLAGSIPDGATPQTLVIAYEPVWAIGTGLTPTAADVAEVHGFIRERLVARFGEAATGIRLLYGGSVKPSNAAELMGVANVDGALVGGASLKATDFLAIASVYR